MAEHKGGTIDHETATDTCSICNEMEERFSKIEVISGQLAEYVSDYKANFLKDPGGTHTSIITGFSVMCDHVVERLKEMTR